MSPPEHSRRSATCRARNPVWSSDGRRVLYASTHGGRAAFWWQTAGGSGPPVLAALPAHNPCNIDLSPDGRSVVDNALYDGSGGRVQISTDGGVHPVWSPDGHRIYNGQRDRLIEAKLARQGPVRVVSRQQLLQSSMSRATDPGF